MPSWFVDPNIVGLLYDAAGIFVFGIPAVFVNDHKIAVASESTWDYDVGAMRILIEQKWDTCVGSILLVAGFAFQIIAATGWRLLCQTAVILWALLMVVPVSYICIRRRIVSKHLNRVVAIAKYRAEQNI